MAASSVSPAEKQPGKSGNPDAYSSALFFFHDSDVMAHVASVFRPVPSLVDFPNQAGAQVFLWMRQGNYDPSSRIAEMVMQSLHAHKNPSLLLEATFYVAAIR
jgi:hypothetical protein